MNLIELNNTYNFHDSCPTNISYDRENKKLIIEMDFCYWMQKNYDKESPEIAPMKLVFSGVKSYDGITGIFDCLGITTQEIRDQKLYFFMEDEIKNEFYDIYIDAESVEINK